MRFTCTQPDFSEHRCYPFCNSQLSLFRSELKRGKKSLVEGGTFCETSQSHVSVAALVVGQTAVWFE